MGIKFVPGGKSLLVKSACENVLMPRGKSTDQPCPRPKFKGQTNYGKGKSMRDMVLRGWKGSERPRISTQNGRDVRKGTSHRSREILKQHALLSRQRDAPHTVSCVWVDLVHSGLEAGGDFVLGQRFSHLLGMQDIVPFVADDQVWRTVHRCPGRVGSNGADLGVAVEAQFSEQCIHHLLFSEPDGGGSAEAGEIVRLKQLVEAVSIDPRPTGECSGTHSRLERFGKSTTVSND